MSLEKNKDNSITIISSNILKLTDDKWDEKFQKWVQECAKLVTAGTPTFKETEQYFLEQCDALPLTTNDNRMNNFQLDVIMTRCRDKLVHQATEFSFDMTEEERKKWSEGENAMRQEAMNSSPQKFGFNIRGYYLPHTERNEVFYDQAYHEFQKMMKLTNQDYKQVKMSDICFFFEETTGHYQFDGGRCSLKNQLIVFMGVREDDIERHSQRFMGYIAALHDIKSGG